MIINEKALEDSNFYIYSNEEAKNDLYIDEIENAISKHNITTNFDYLSASNENKYIAIVNHSIFLFHRNEVLPNDIKKIFLDNQPFKNTLNKILKKRLDNLINNDSAIFFKELTSMIHLLCLGEEFKIFKSYNNYDFDLISDLFRLYENVLREQNEKDSELFDTTFESYIILLKALTQLCVINATDIFRKKTINPIIDLMTETINMLKFTIPLNEYNMNKINNILGEHLYYFAHVSYIKINKDDIDYSLKEYHMYLERQIDGFELSRNSNFGDEGEVAQHNEFITFKNNASFLLLTLLQKLNFNFKDYNYFENSNFEKLLTLYYEMFALKTVDFKIPDNEKEFKRNLVDSLLHNYQIDLKRSKELNHHTIIDDFIFSGHSFDNRNLETTHNILLFSDDIEDYKYIHIGELLVATKSIQNDYYEFFKLKTLDIIINHFMNKEYNEEIESLLVHIHEYVRVNKVASHLLSMYSKIYLSLALYYSGKTHNEELVFKGKDFYAIFIQTNGINLLKNQYKFINEKILFNIGKYYQDKYKLNDCDISKEQLLSLSKANIKEFLDYRELNLKYEIRKGFTELSSKIHKNSDIGYNEINKVIVSLITKKIFHGICEVFILGLGTNINKKFDAGYKQYKIDMTEKYSILFIFPAVYEDNFKYIINYNKDFIKNNISNILRSYEENSVNYIDNITGLYNLTKLTETLDTKKEDEELTFIEIYIDELFNINSMYSYETGNDVFRQIGEKIENLFSINDLIFKLNGARIGILLNTNEYEEVLYQLKLLSIKLHEDIIDLDLYICITKSKKDELIKKSSKNMDKAIRRKQREFIDGN